MANFMCQLDLPKGCPHSRWKLFLGVSIRMFLERLAFGSVDWVKKSALTTVGGHHHQSFWEEGYWIQQKGEAGETSSRAESPSFPALGHHSPWFLCLPILGLTLAAFWFSGLWPPDWELHYLLPWFPGLWTWTALYHQSSRFCSLQTAALGTS